MLAFFGFFGFAQDNLENIGARKLKRMAAASERENDWETAAIYYQAYLSKNASDISATYKLAENYRQGGNYKAAQNSYRIVHEKNSSKYPLASFHYAHMLSFNGNCKLALPIFKNFKKAYRGKKEERKYTKLTKNAIEACENLRTENSNSKFIIKPLSDKINGIHIEASPIFLSSNEIIYNSLKVNSKMLAEDETAPKRKFYKLENKNGIWEPKGEWERTELYLQMEIANGAFNFNKTRFYFSACERNSLGKIACDIYVMQKVDDVWKRAKKLPAEVNTPFTETQVAVGVDEKENEVVYFVSDRNEGKGGLDIWYSIYDAKKDTYKASKNVGSKINSIGDEVTPYIYPYDRTLYFSSNGHSNFGGLDIFKSNGEKSKWLEPKNLGSTVNTNADELYYVLNEKGDAGFFASNRLKKDSELFCCDDIYEFKDLEKISITLKGKLIDRLKSDLNKEVEGVEIKLYKIDVITKERILVNSYKTNDGGNYKFRLETDENYIIQTNKEGYLIQEHDIITNGIIKSTTFTKVFSLEYYFGRSIIVENIYYKFDKANLTDDAMNTIDTTIYEILVENPSIIIELGSHTDSEGTDVYNRDLSQDRAQSVVDYLIKKGINRKRLKAKGYGESSPITENKNFDGSDNPKGRAKNRRTEFKVIGEIDATINYKR